MISLSFVDNELDNTLHARCSQSSQLSVDNAVILQQSDIQRLDSELSNSPRDLYIQQLLQLTANNEQMLAWYRNALYPQEPRLLRVVPRVTLLIENQPNEVAVLKN